MAGAEVVDSGEKRLNELGYKQELRREMVRTVRPLIISFHFLYPAKWVCIGSLRIRGKDGLAGDGEEDLPPCGLQPPVFSDEMRRWLHRVFR